MLGLIDARRFCLLSSVKLTGERQRQAAMSARLRVETDKRPGLDEHRGAG